MSKLYKAIIAVILITIVATYADILLHQRDGMYGGEIKHTLPTTRVLYRMIEDNAPR